MNLRQQIIQQNIETIAQALKVSDDVAFLRFANSLLLNQSIHAFDLSCLVDGGQDKQIDTITIEQGFVARIEVRSCGDGSMVSFFCDEKENRLPHPQLDRV